MVSPNTTVSPESPCMPISEPELERKLMMSYVKDADTIRFNKESADSVLELLGLEVDDDGYVRHIDTGEYAKPHAHSRNKFQNQEDSYWAPIEEVFHNTEDEPLSERMGDINKIHLDDVYGITSTDDKDTIVVYDNWSNILSRVEDTELDLKIKTEWENSTEMVEMFY